MDYLRSLRVLNIKSVVRRAFRLTSLSEKTRKPNRSPQWTKTLSFSLSRVDPTTSHKVQPNWDKRTEDIYFSLQWWQIVVVYFREYSCHINSFHSWWTRQITCLPNFGWELVSGCENNFKAIIADVLAIAFKCWVIRIWSWNVVLRPQMRQLVFPPLPLH